MSDMVFYSADEVEPDGIGYRYYISQVTEPSILYDDVCPAGYETVWYTYEADDDAPVVISFRSEVHPSENDLSNFFAPVFRETQRANTGQEAFTAPVYIGSCSYSDKSGVFYRDHAVTVESTGTAYTANVRCQILVNNSGKETVIYESETPYQTMCFGEQ